MAKQCTRAIDGTRHNILGTPSIKTRPFEDDSNSACILVKVTSYNPYTNCLSSNLPQQSLVVRATDSRPEGLGSMPDAAKYSPSAHGTRRVAGQVDRSECAVRNCWEQWTREGTHARKTGSGATRKTTRREDRRIVRQALEDPTVTRSTIRADVGVAIVPQTISRHLAEANLKSKSPFRALPLTPEHRQLRLQWCQARSMWNVTDWLKVVFSDESRFVLGTDDNRVRVWRRPGERYNSPHTVLRRTARTAAVMVWGS
ncbi:transposable element Tc1 transposase [Trichonephila clavipes]|nr:transposable element Tc1 transposase [Trichonephila clavipes]